MPKKVSRAEVAKWRELYAQGMEYAAIGQATGWQPRTVRKYLDSDLRSTEGAEIRRELFKERLGRHWDMLLEGVLGHLCLLAPPDFGESQALTGWLVPVPRASGVSLQKWITLTGASDISLPGAVVHRDGDWDITAQVQARAAVEWPLLMQHMARDPLWATVRSWEDDFRVELLALRGLYVATEERLKRVTSLSIVSQLSGSPALTCHGVQLVFDRICRRVWAAAAGGPGADLTQRDVFEPNAEEVMIGDTKIAYAPGHSSRVAKAVKDTIKTWERFSEAAEVKIAVGALRETTDRLQRMIAHLRLLPYLPGVCAVCGRIEI